MDPKQWRTEHTSIQNMPGPLDLRHPCNHLKPLPLNEVSQKSGGRGTGTRVLNTQEGIAQLCMRGTAMMETVLGKPTTGSSNAEWTQSPEGVRVVKNETDSQEGTKGRGGRQSGGDWI